MLFNRTRRSTQTFAKNMKAIPRVARAVVRHIAFRIGIAVASAALTVSLLLGIAVNLAFMQPYAPLSHSENLAASVMAAAFSIPTLFGVVMLVPQSRTWVRWVGATVVFVAAPGLLTALLVSGYVETFSEEFYWILLWMFVAILYWAMLRREADGEGSR